jgi:hypothetical protein
MKLGSSWEANSRLASREFPHVFWNHLITPIILREKYKLWNPTVVNFTIFLLTPIRGIDILDILPLETLSLGSLSLGVYCFPH